MRYIKLLIETECRDFCVAGIAENGREALERIEDLQPDIVITDIKMPVMDGIELISRLKMEYPNIYSVAISGYQDFQYVKEAFKLGATDYLLKPVKVSQMSKLLNLLSAKLDSLYEKTGREILEQIVSGSAVETRRIERYITSRSFYIVIARKNGLPSRFYTKLEPAPGSFTGRDIIELKAELDVQNCWLLEGRDEYEAVMVLGSGDGYDSMTKKVSELFSGLYSSDCYYTVVCLSHFITLDQLEETVGNMYRLLDLRIVIGKNQIFASADWLCDNDALPVLSSSSKNKLSFLVGSRSFDVLKRELTELFVLWEKESCTQAQVERMIRQILDIAEKYSAAALKNNDLNVEKALDEALFYAKSYKELAENVWDIIGEVLAIFENTGNRPQKDPLAVLEKVERYIGKNLSESISLQSVCDSFGVSQTYMSKLFRKYRNTSFNELVTQNRINEAKKIMAENPDMHLKNIAEIVGYKDQYYFSRVFKAVTGSAPSAYSNDESI